ncbi:hypothetical protein [Streptomyces sp. NPDC006463]|uniref:hypothetical protein n=1 Tax=Streptomyces sp. NPDC006463 TaxID=3364746 RepID=UPI00368382DC
MAVIGTWNMENLYRFGGRFGTNDEPVYGAKLQADDHNDPTGRIEPRALAVHLEPAPDHS